MVLEVTTRLLEPMRNMLGSVVAPVFFVAELPYLAGGDLGDLVATHETLRKRTHEQDQQLLELSHIAQQYHALKTENERLRALLGSRARLPSAVLIAELEGVVPTPEIHQIILDKGDADGVKVGAPVIDAYGLFGQIVATSRHSSRVLLVTDANHAVPVQINRNGMRSIAGGTGDPVYMELENVPVTADITEGDLVETSGLGGGFPAGYPVGRVASVRIESNSAFAVVRVEPMAELDRSRHLLVILDVPTGADDGAGTTEAAATDHATAPDPKDGSSGDSVSAAVAPAGTPPGSATPREPVAGSARPAAEAAQRAQSDPSGAVPGGSIEKREHGT